jgi:predicted nuclease with TOPRIM domain
MEQAPEVKNCREKFERSVKELEQLENQLDSDSENEDLKNRKQQLLNIMTDLLEEYKQEIKSK